MSVSAKVGTTGETGSRWASSGALTKVEPKPTRPKTT